MENTNALAVAPHILVIFGASGDLTIRKLVPSLNRLYEQGFLPEGFTVLGASRSDLGDEGFRKRVVLDNPFVGDDGDTLPADRLKAFASGFFYHDLGADYDSDYSGLRERIMALTKDRDTGQRVLFYLSTPPKIYSVIAKNLAACGLNDEREGWKRLIVEKPFGYDLNSAIALNTELQQHFKEKQIFRIDHYLGKETVQNLLVTRFATVSTNPCGTVIILNVWKSPMQKP